MELGTQVGGYRVDKLIGRGGMAEVYQVWNTGLHRHEALKVLPPQMTFDRTFVERFLAEARMAAQLQHHNIVSIHTVSDVNGPDFFFAMELVDGGDLAALLERHGSFSISEALPILQQIAEALDYAHSHRVLHRDVKPANVLLKGNGRDGWIVKVVDFGIARAAEDSGGTRLTKTGMIVGTPEYMSPEQGGSGKPVDHRTDIYSLGVIAYEMLCGRPPFRSEQNTTPISVIMQHVRDLPPSPVEINPSLPTHVNNALLVALAKDPVQRFDTCSDFVRALSGERMVALPPTIVEEPPKPPGPTGPPKWNWSAWMIAAAIIIGACLIFAGMNIGHHGTTSVPKQFPPPPKPPQPSVTTHSVPDVVGKTVEYAQQRIRDESLKPEIEQVHSDSTVGLVLSQDPNAGTNLNQGQTVHLKVSSGPSLPPTGDEVAEIKRRYNEWLQAWQNRSIDAYMTFYSPRVVEKRVGKAPYGYNELRRRMTETWSKQASISISSEEPTISVDGVTARVSAYQSYDSTTWWDKGVKKLKWLKDSGNWVIIEESFQMQSGGRK